jgi:hypothetical protein
MYVSIVKLIANPEKFDGKFISVIGFLRLETEGNALYLSHEDYQHGMSANALHVVRTEQIARDSEKLDMNYVHIEGVFNAKHVGYFPFPSGEIEQITTCTLWSELKYPRAQKYKDLWEKKPN